MLIWLAATDIAHHSAYLPWAPCAIGEIIYDITDWAGRAVTAGFEITHFSTTLLCCLLFISILALATLLAKEGFASRYLLSDLNNVIPKNGSEQGVDYRCATVAAAYNLSVREHDVLRYICKGRSKPYIAEALCLSENTVATYTRRLYSKLGVHSKQELLDLVFES
jgi:DNA-binding CsgD family transcriptional regulator